MTDEEDIEVVKAILAQAQGRFLTGSNSSAESLRKAEALERAGVDGLLLITPYNKSNEGIIYQHFSVCT